jgi:hypothetical protein
MGQIHPCNFRLFAFRQSQSDRLQIKYYDEPLPEYIESRCLTEYHDGREPEPFSDRAAQPRKKKIEKNSRP